MFALFFIIILLIGAFLLLLSLGTYNAAFDPNLTLIPCDFEEIEKLDDDFDLIAEFDHDYFKRLSDQFAKRQFEMMGDYRITTKKDDLVINGKIYRKSRRFARYYIHKEAGIGASIEYAVTRTKIADQQGSNFRVIVNKSFYMGTSFTDGTQIITLCGQMPHSFNVHNAYKFMCRDIDQSEKLITMHMEKVKEVSQKKVLDTKASEKPLQESIPAIAREEYAQNPSTFRYDPMKDIYHLHFWPSFLSTMDTLYFMCFQKKKDMAAGRAIISKTCVKYNKFKSPFALKLATTLSILCFLIEEIYIDFIHNGKGSPFLILLRLITLLAIILMFISAIVYKKKKEKAYIEADFEEE